MKLISANLSTSLTGHPTLKSINSSQNHGLSQKIKAACFAHFLLCLLAQLCLTLLQPRELQPVRLLCPPNSSGKNTGVGCHSFLQGIFPSQGSNCSLLHCKQILYPLSHQGSPCPPLRSHFYGASMCMN